MHWSEDAVNRWFMAFYRARLKQYILHSWTFASRKWRACHCRSRPTLKKVSSMLVRQFLPVFQCLVASFIFAKACGEKLPSWDWQQHITVMRKYVDFWRSCSFWRMSQWTMWLCCLTRSWVTTSWRSQRMKEFRSSTNISKITISDTLQRPKLDGAEVEKPSYLIPYTSSVSNQPLEHSFSFAWLSAEDEQFHRSVARCILQTLASASIYLWTGRCFEKGAEENRGHWKLFHCFW